MSSRNARSYLLFFFFFARYALGFCIAALVSVLIFFLHKFRFRIRATRLRIRQNPIIWRTIELSALFVISWLGLRLVLLPHCVIRTASYGTDPWDPHCMNMYYEYTIILLEPVMFHIYIIWILYAENFGR